MMQQRSLLPPEEEPPKSPVFLLDNNMILELTRRSYTPKKYPNLHRELDKMIAAGQVRSVREVMREFEEGVIKQPDVSLKWCQEHEEMFMPIDDLTDQQLALVSQLFKHDVVNSMRPYADPHLVAYALAHGAIIVTNEGSTPKANHPKIPEIMARYEKETYTIWKFFLETGLNKYI